MSSLKEIEERQKRMYQLIDQMTAEEDMTRMLQLVQLIENEAKELEAAGMAFQAKMDKQTGKPQRSGFEVVLTHEQRSRILKATGVTMDTVIIKDSSGSLNQAMPTTAPAEIEAEAMRQAKARKIDGEARGQARVQAERQLAELENQGPLFAEQVARLKQDPRFREILCLDDKKK